MPKNRFLKRIGTIFQRMFSILVTLLCILYILDHAFGIKLIRSDREQLRSIRNVTRSEQSVVVMRGGKVLFDCDNIDEIKLLGVLNMGMWKTAYLGLYGVNQVLVMKTVRNMPGCPRASMSGNGSRECKLITEETNKYHLAENYLDRLNHPAIISNLGCCDEGHREISAKQTQAPVCLEQMAVTLSWVVISRWTWYKRLKVAIELVDLMIYLEHTDYGSFRLDDFWINNFMMMNERILVTDPDSLTNEPVNCDTTPFGRQQKVCKVLKENNKIVKNRNKTTEIDPPSEVDFNAYFNIYFLDKVVFKNLLHIRCGKYKAECDRLTDKIQTADWSAEQVKKHLLDLIEETQDFKWLNAS